MKLPDKLQVPIEVILIVVVPFALFLGLFMYLAGLIPAQPIVVEIPQDAVVRDMGEVSGGTGRAEQATQSPTETSQPETETAAAEVAEEEKEPETEPLKETVEQVPEESSSLPAPVPRDPIDEERAARVKQIAKVYDQMNATSVAAIVKSMGDDDAVEILSMMNPRNAARVLAALEPDKAARLSLMLTE